MAALAELVAYADELLAVGEFTDYCPNGLQVEGRPEVARIVGGVSASQALLDEAAARGVDLVLVHHGWFWRGEDACIVGIKRRRLATLLRHDIGLLAYHLPLDAHPELGNNAQLARVLGLRATATFGEGRRPLGMVGEPAEPLPGAAFAAHLEARLGRAPLFVPGHGRPIRRIAWCTGAAQGLIEQAARTGADAYLSGEVSEPTVHAARELGLHYYAAGHHATERYGVAALGARLAARFGLAFDFVDIPNPA